MPDWRQLLRTSAFVVAAAAVAAFFRLSNPLIDPDSFYHFRHGAIYAERGPLYADFPWLVHSIIGRYGGDIGYGFHLLLAPITFMDDPILGTRLAATAGLVVLLLMLHLVLKRHRVTYAALWPFAVVLLSPPMLLVLQMTRPHTLSTGLAVVLVSCLLRGRPWAVLLASFGIAFLHLNISPIILALAATALLVKRLTEKQWEWWKLAAAMGGWALGWVCRPAPLEVAKHEYVQVLVHAAARQQDVPLVFGQEWQPLAPATLLFGYASFLFIWVAFSIAFLVGEAARRPLPAEKRSLLWSSFLLGALFLALTMLNTRRGMTLWAAFSVFFVAGAFDALLLPELRQRGPRQRLLRALALVVFAAFLFRAVNVADEMVFRPKWLGSAPDRARVAAVWLRENTPAGSTVLNVNWWDFPELFFWNTHNRYVGGLDPIFQYAHDPALYWKVHHLELGDALPLTCGDEVCSPDNSEDIPTVVQRDFDAEFLVVDSEINLDLYNYLRSADEFEFCVEDQKMAVFRRIPTPSPPPHRSPSPAPVSTQE